MTIGEALELASYVVTVVGLPFAIGAFLIEQRRERENEEEEGYQLLSDAYNDFLKIVLANADLRLRSHGSRLGRKRCTRRGGRCGSRLRGRWQNARRRCGCARRRGTGSATRAECGRQHAAPQTGAPDADTAPGGGLMA